METHILPEIFEMIKQINLPTVIKIEEVKREEITKALKNFDATTKNVQVGLIAFYWRAQFSHMKNKAL